MSADNFMAVLITSKPDGTGLEYRVGELRASEAWYETGFDGLYDAKKFEELKSWAYEIWYGSNVYLTKDAAYEHIYNYETDNIVEYGSSSYEFPYPFDQTWNKK